MQEYRSALMGFPLELCALIACWDSFNRSVVSIDPVRFVLEWRCWNSGGGIEGPSHLVCLLLDALRRGVPVSKVCLFICKQQDLRPQWEYT